MSYQPLFQFSSITVPLYLLLTIFSIFSEYELKQSLSNLSLYNLFMTMNKKEKLI